MNKIVNQKYSRIKSLTDAYGIGIDHVEVIPDGRTNESFIVFFRDDRFFVRIAGEGTERYIDRKKEIYNISIAQKIGVSPRLLYTNKHDLLLEYIEGLSTTNQKILDNQRMLDKVTLQMRALHSSSEAFIGVFSFFDRAVMYRNEFLETGCGIPKELLECEDALFDLLHVADESNNDQSCPCHGDIVLQNFIIGDQRAYIVDWEYSTMANPYLDLASFCIQNDLTETREKHFLDSYFSDKSLKLNVAKHSLYKAAISFMWVYWHLNNVARDKQPEYNDPRWRLRFKNAIDNKNVWQRLAE